MSRINLLSAAVLGAGLLLAAAVGAIAGLPAVAALRGPLPGTGQLAGTGLRSIGRPACGRSVRPQSNFFF